MKKNKTNKFKTNKNKTNKFKTNKNKTKTRKYKNKKFAKGLKEEIKFYVKERLGIYEPKLVKIMTKELEDEEELKKLVEDKKNYKKYKENIEKNKETMEKKKEELDILDSQGAYRSMRRYPQRISQREDKLQEIKRLENNIYSYIYIMQKLEKKYPNINLSN